MEYLAKIIKEEKSRNRQFRRYTFLDLKTGETDWFISNYRIGRPFDVPGKLELSWDKNERYKLYDRFEQDEVNLTEEEEEVLFYSQEQTELDTKRLAKDLVRRKKAELEARQIAKLRQKGYSWNEVANFFEVSKRDIRRKRNPNIKPLQKAGRKRIIDRKDRYFLISYLSDYRATLKEMSDYLFEKVNKRISTSTIYLELKRIKYSYQVIPYRHPKQKQNLLEVIEFMERVNQLPQHLILSTDESGHPLNLASRRGWGPAGDKISDFKPSYGTNYSLILVIRNTEKEGIIHWELVKDTVNTEIFTNFLTNIKLSNEERHYLLLDNIAFHKSIKVKEVLANKNIEPRYIVASNPYLNPVEEVFNVIKQYVRKQRPRTGEELGIAVSKIISILQKEDLRKHFKDCLDFDFIWKSGQEF